MSQIPAEGQKSLPSGRMPLFENTQSCIFHQASAHRLHMGICRTTGLKTPHAHLRYPPEKCSDSRFGSHASSILTFGSPSPPLPTFHPSLSHPACQSNRMSSSVPPTSKKASKAKVNPDFLIQNLTLFLPKSICEATHVPPTLQTLHITTYRLEVIGVIVAQLMKAV